MAADAFGWFNFKGNFVSLKRLRDVDFVLRGPSFP